MKHFFILISFILLISSASFSQTDHEKAKTIALDAVKEFDKGNYEKAITMLDEALQLDPGNYIYRYEKALSHYAMVDYAKAIEISEPLLSESGVEDLTFQLVGNSYDMIGQPDKAIEIYKKGLDKFSGSGKLYLEIGNVYVKQEKYEEAVDSWEKGIKVEPNYPSNYYQLAKLFSRTEEEIWGLLYGEMFMNLERATDRTYEISNMIYDIYKRTITVESGKVVKVSITKNSLTPGDIKDGSLPFETSYELLTAICSVNLATGFNIQNLYELKKDLVTAWFEKSAVDHPNLLLNWEKKILDRGLFEPYIYWLLRDGNEQDFDKWFKNNKESFEKFANWMKDNKFSINSSGKYSRKDYMN